MLPNILAARNPGSPSPKTERCDQPANIIVKARDNPFASDRVEATLDFEPSWSESGLDWTGLLDRWRTLRFRATIVGPNGSGKSTLLRSLAAHLRSQGGLVRDLFLNDQKNTLSEEEWQDLERLTDCPGRTTVLLDGAEQLSWRGRHRFRKIIDRHAFRVLGTHHRPGRWPTLISTTTTPALLAHLIEKLTRDSSSPSLTESQIEDLFARHRGNLREALWECYDRAADRAGNRRSAHFQRTQPSADAAADVATPMDLTQIQ